MASKWIDDQYRIRRKIVGGNMSTVYECEDDDGNSVIIKLYDKCTGENNDDLQEKIFRREVESLEKVQHPNIVKIIDKGFDANLEKFYVALEYVDGKSFEESFADLSCSEYYAKIELMENVLGAVEYLHKKSIVHRDLKPSNLMFNRDGAVKIIDFGISKFKDTFYSEYTVCNFSTPKYSSPEQVEGKTITGQSDIYSLGVIFYEVFKGERIKDRNVIVVNDLPEGMRDIISKMLNKDITLRYAQISEIKRDIAYVKSQLRQDKFLSIGITKNVSSRLYQYGFIKDDELPLAASVIEKDLSGKRYIKTNRSGNNEVLYHLIGKQYISICKIDNRNSKRFTITSIIFLNAAELSDRKENAFEVPYKIKVSALSNRIISTGEVNINDLIEELMVFKSTHNDIKANDLHVKDIASKWGEILKLQRDKIEKEKCTIRYKSFTANEKDNSIEIELEKDAPEIEFTSDNMLTMTTKISMYKVCNVGFMRECKNSKMIIDLARNTNIENVANSGEISISNKMVEIALNRQTRALKNVRFKEIVNPIISDIIFNPERATSRECELISAKECQSPFIDKSKLVSLEKALSADNLFLLQGPPGTGKTTFISELVFQILKRNEQSRILIASQSHVAVDHSLTKIKELIPKIKMIRIGIKEKFSESVINYTLDAFCKEWTAAIISKCQKAIEEYKNEMGIDESLHEKNDIILEIEQLSEAISCLASQLSIIEEEKNKIEILNDKWKFINEKIAFMKNLVSVKMDSMSGGELEFIVNAFMDDISDLSGKLEIVLEESIHLSDQKDKFEHMYGKINLDIESKGQDVSYWKQQLGVSSEEEYNDLKAHIENTLQENQDKYKRFSKIEGLCREWITRVEQGDGLLQESVADATVVGATCLGIAGLGSTIDLDFDWVIVDEAGKATPPEILVPIALGKKIVLVGDHKQLPPIVDESLIKESKENQYNITKKDLETSLFEYLEKKLNDNCKSILDEQYRMNPVIGELISQMFYDGKLISKTSKEQKSIPLDLFNKKSLVWLSTARRPDNKEEMLKSDQYYTFRNRCEVDIIFDYLLRINDELGKLRLKKEIAIIAGYRAQRDLLISMHESKYLTRLNNITLEINTVDAFQGRETDIVFYSVVRSNEEGNLGFLKDVRRLNVAFSRARELLIVVGNHQVVTKKVILDGQNNPFVGIIQYIYSNREDCLVEEVK